MRVFHWSLVLLFILSYISGEEEGALHIYTSYGVLAAVGFRIIWGFIGTKYARFSNFIYGPGATLEYAKSMFSGNPVHYTGHNPVGGWMVMALLAFLLAASISGLKLYATEGHGPLAGESYTISPAWANGHGDEAEHEDAAHELWEEVHELLANFTLILVFLHIAGVLIASVIHRENLIRAMITGYKK